MGNDRFVNLRRVLAMAMVVSALSGAVVAMRGAPSHAFERRIMGGSGAGGSTNVVALAARDEQGWWLCSAAMWKPRVLITAAHCVTKEGSADAATEVRVFAPGAEAVVFSNTGPQGASSVPVTTILRPAGYVNASTLVQPNDIAFLVLGADLAPAGFSRLASTAELTQWVSVAKPVTHVGYGLTGPGQRSTTPHATTLSLTQFLNGRYGQQFSTAQTAQVSICPGDSGSPAFVDQATGDLLLGTMAGGTGVCGTAAGVPSSLAESNVGLAAIGYPDLADAALTQAGYAAIPGAPTDREGTSSGSTVYLAWLPPSRNASSITGYEVLDASGTVVCTTVATSCRVDSVQPGTYGYRVRSVNAQGEGEARPEAIAVTVSNEPPMRSFQDSDEVPWVTGDSMSIVDGCFASKKGRRKLQADIAGSWVTLASAPLTRDRATCPRRNRPYSARYDFTVPGASTPGAEVALRTVGRLSAPTRTASTIVFPTYEAMLNAELLARNPGPT